MQRGTHSIKGISTTFVFNSIYFYISKFSCIEQASSFLLFVDYVINCWNSHWLLLFEYSCAFDLYMWLCYYYGTGWNIYFYNILWKFIKVFTSLVQIFFKDTKWKKKTLLTTTPPKNIITYLSTDACLIHNIKIFLNVCNFIYN
jgi:hypothetical protein